MDTGDKTTSEQKPRTEISYCPEMGLYRFKRANGDLFLFDNERLVADLDYQMKHGGQREADFMALLTGMARRAPHKLVAVDEDGNVNVSDLVRVDTFDDEKSGDGSPQG